MTAFIVSVTVYLVAQVAWLLLLEPGQAITWSERRIRIVLMLRLCLVGWAAYLLWGLR